MQWQCNHLPSYWIRQVRHTNASSLDALIQRKTNVAARFNVWYVSHTISPFFFVWGIRSVSVIVYFIFCVNLLPSWGNIPHQSCWSLSCDRGLRCSDEFIWNKILIIAIIIIYCLQILFTTQSGNCTLRPPRFLPVFRCSDDKSRRK